MLFIGQRSLVIMGALPWVVLTLLCAAQHSTVQRSTAQYRTEQPAMTMCGAVQSYDIVENMNDLMLSC